VPGGSRIVERTAVQAYRGTSWVIQHVPERLARAVIGTLTQASYLAWPEKRRWSNANFGHVLHRDPNDPEVRRLALAAYRTYARYLVELMRLPGLPSEEVAGLVEPVGIEKVRQIWDGSRGLILVAGHVGSNEAVAAGIASQGWPVSVVADDTSFPELFDLLRRQREEWGVKIIPWRNLRAIYGVLRRGEILGLLVDWGYRNDGIPVRLFDAWTTLPAGPAVLAAKTGATILPVVIRRMPDGRFTMVIDEPIRPASSKPVDIQRATQAVADALARSIGAAPEQWYSFKPMWPQTPAEQAELATRAAYPDAAEIDLETAGPAGIGAFEPEVGLP
jgi:KDO2-lipid IV(A) lauroyltransferase